jgi:hypothetical protein
VKRDTLLKLAFSIAFLAALFLVIWIDLATDTKREIEQFIRDYQGILLSIGTLTLISLLTLAAAQITSNSAERRDVFNRRIQAELQIANFRQLWINELRSDLAVVQSGLSNMSSDKDNFETLTAYSRVLMRLNPEEENTKELQRIMKRRTDKEPDYSASEFQSICGKILKSEWGRLKKDLTAAQETTT